MTEHQKDQILKVVSYYMEPELRDRIMREAPIAYNAWVGYPVVDIRRVVANQRLTEKIESALEGYTPTVSGSQPKEPPKNP